MVHNTAPFVVIESRGLQLACPSYDLRKNYRPITLQNDLLKVLDACVYYMLARETRTVPEPPPPPPPPPGGGNKLPGLGDNQEKNTVDRPFFYSDR
eukprot:SAG31_NODE_24751_length_474_cov_11.570667_1_plen_95_part_10